VIRTPKSPAPKQNPRGIEDIMSEVTPAVPVTHVATKPFVAHAADAAGKIIASPETHTPALAAHETSAQATIHAANSARLAAAKNAALAHAASAHTVPAATSAPVSAVAAAPSTPTSKTPVAGNTVESLAAKLAGDVSTEFHKGITAVENLFHHATTTPTGVVTTVETDAKADAAKVEASVATVAEAPVKAAKAVETEVKSATTAVAAKVNTTTFNAETEINALKARLDDFNKRSGQKI
jgi:hypothetical protein